MNETDEPHAEPLPDEAPVIAPDSLAAEPAQHRRLGRRRDPEAVAVDPAPAAPPRARAGRSAAVAVPPAPKAKAQEGDSLIETVKTIVYALLIALVIRTFLFQPFNIPSGSMEATLLVGDYLFVEKFAYGYSKNSFPFSPPCFRGACSHRSRIAAT
jgi:hypothetical protein